MTIRGPKIITKGGHVRDGFQSQKVWYTQDKPYVQPLEFHHWNQKWDANNPLARARASNWPHSVSIFRESLQARAYDDFHNKVASRANILLNAYEFNKTVSMVARRAIQLKRAVSSFKKLRFADALNHLNVPDASSRASRLKKTASAKGLSSTWLEITFGWLPVISDIFTACNILQRPFPVERVSGSAKATHFIEYFDPYHLDHLTGIDQVRTSARVVFNNPNLLLANQLGLLNPVLVAWDAVPFSFVFDWFIPVNKFLSSITNGIGVTFERGRTSFRQSYVGDVMEKNYPKSFGNYSGKSFFRLPRLVSRPNLFSRTRLPSANAWLAATSLSLVVQQLKTFK